MENTEPITVQEFFVAWESYQGRISDLVTPENIPNIIPLMQEERDSFYEWCDRVGLYFKKPDPLRDDPPRAPKKPKPLASITKLPTALPRKRLPISANERW